MKKYLDQTGLQDYTTKLTAKNKTIFATKAEVGAPLVAATAAAMTDQTKVYVYVGSETGYTNGNWYYYDGEAWTSGGVYNSIALTEAQTAAMNSGITAALVSEFEAKPDDDEVYKKAAEDTSITGCSGYYIHSINTAEKWIILSDATTKPALPQIGTDVEDDSDPTADIGYAANDLISIINGAHYDFCNKITAVAGNKITYSGNLPFDSIDDSGTGNADHCLFVAKKPTTGVIVIVTVAFGSGLGAIGAGKASVAIGRDTVSSDYAAAFGRENIAAYCSLVYGLLNVVTGRYAIGGGSYSQAAGEYSAALGCVAKALGDSAAAINNNTTAKGRFSFAHGLGTVAKTDTMESGGKYNRTQEDCLVVYGNGTDDSHRADAFKLDLVGTTVQAGAKISKFVKEDYFDSGNRPFSNLGFTSFDQITEAGFYNLMWYNKNNYTGEEEVTPWTVMVSTKKVNGELTKIYQLREAYGQASGKRYWKDYRSGTVTDGVITWTEWTEVGA